VSGADVSGWARALQANPELLARVHRERGWDGEVLVELAVGFDGDRITAPITDERRALQGLLRLRVAGWQSPKVRTAFGTRLGLIPHPSLEPRQSVLLVEGPGDMLAARSVGLPAIAVPGTYAWRAEWAQLLAGREVTVVMDCDRGVGWRLTQ
jgi:DNA primase